MEDFQIVDLYWARDEAAIRATQTKYGRMLRQAAYAVLQSSEDSEECENDTYVAAWRQIPPERPVYLGAYLTKIVRNLALKRYRREHAQKRTLNRVFEELNEITMAEADAYALSEQVRQEELGQKIRDFLAEQSEEKRAVFVRRYFYGQEIETIAKELHMSKSKVKMMLLRMRQALQIALGKEER